MAEFEEKLSSILENQEAMAQIMALARSLSGNGEEAGEAPSRPGDGEEASHGQESAPRGEEQPDLARLLDSVDPGMVQMGLRLFREYRGEDDRRTALLQALRPYLREERRARLDRAVRLAQMTRLIRAALGAMGEKGDEEGV